MGLIEGSTGVNSRVQVTIVASNPKCASGLAATSSPAVTRQTQEVIGTNLVSTLLSVVKCYGPTDHTHVSVGREKTLCGREHRLGSIEKDDQNRIPLVLGGA